MEALATFFSMVPPPFFLAGYGRTLSYFEFYRPCIQPLYIHKYPVSSAADQCPLTSLTSAPLDVSTRPRLFNDITETDVMNLISSLRSNTPVFFAEAQEASGAAGAASSIVAASGFIAGLFVSKTIRGKIV